MAHGRFFWNELITRDAEAAKAFFAEALGWRYEPFGGGDYWVIMDDEGAVGGIMPLSDEADAAMAERWIAYVEVDDIDARLKGVPSAGGRVLREPFDIPEVGRIAIIADRFGAVLGWITPAQGQQT